MFVSAVSFSFYHNVCESVEHSNVPNYGRLLSQYYKTFFSLSLTAGPDKLERLSMESFLSQVKYL